MGSTLDSQRSFRATRRSAKATPAGGRTLGLASGTTLQVVGQLQKGLPYAAILRLHKVSGLPVGTIADLVRIPPRTLMRRKAAGRLQPDESEKLLRLSGIFEKALGLFEGDAPAARRWLTAPRDDFERLAPLDMARTEIGAREVEDLIGRLEYGVFA